MDSSDTRAEVGSHIFVKAKLNLRYFLKVTERISTVPINGPLHFKTVINKFNRCPVISTYLAFGLPKSSVLASN